MVAHSSVETLQNLSCKPQALAAGRRIPGRSTEVAGAQEPDADFGVITAEPGLQDMLRCHCFEARLGAFTHSSVSAQIPCDVGEQHRDRDHKAYLQATRARDALEAVRHIPEVSQDVLDGPCAAVRV